MSRHTCMDLTRVPSKSNTAYFIYAENEWYFVNCIFPGSAALNPTTVQEETFDIQKYIAERKKRFPTQLRIAQAKELDKEYQQRGVLRNAPENF